jgi:hypothetical protein
MQLAQTHAAFDGAVNRLVKLIETGFDRDFILQLAQFPGIDLSRAETELRFLDLFAAYLAIRLSESRMTTSARATLFQRVCVDVLASWSLAWDTKDDVVEVLKGRFAAYDRLADAPGLADLEAMTPLIGLLCAVIIRDDRRVFGNDAAAAEALATVLIDRSENHNLLCVTAATVFRSRFNAVSEQLLTLSC